jgi:sialate O-acetylesterase
MRGKIVLRAGGAILAVCCLVAVAAADVKLPGVFGDHMVLQRDAALPVWGWADPGEQVTVTLAEQSKSATADDNGHWSVKLDATPAGGPYLLKVRGKNAIEKSDILVGEVWLCSGQSNMEMTVGGVQNVKTEIAESKFPKIRMFTVAKKTAIKPLDDCSGTWKLCSPETVGSFSAAGYFFGRRLHKELDVPVGLINSSWGGTPIQAWTSTAAQEAQPELKGLVDGYHQAVAKYNPAAAKETYARALAAWNKSAAEAKAAGRTFTARKPNPPQSPELSQNSPATLYNGMIAPLAPYAIRGAIWYQGESNAGAAHLYGLQLRTMIANWRADFREFDFPFLWVQLPNFMAPQKTPSETSGWTGIREQMLKTLAVPNTGMAVTIELGDEKNIHPKNKQDVGSRLAQWALAKTYGRDIVACGPLYKSMRADGDKIVIAFDYTDGGLAMRQGDKLAGFAIAGPDKKFVWADARIEGDTVVVSSGEVKSPAAVRYGWANNPNPPCNLINKAGLSASPFRTDDWKQ